MTDKAIFTQREVVDAIHVRLYFLRADGVRRAVIVQRAYDTPEHIAAIGEAIAADRVQSKEQIKREGLR